MGLLGRVLALKAKKSYCLLKRRATRCLGFFPGNAKAEKAIAERNRLWIDWAPVP